MGTGYLEERTLIWVISLGHEFMAILLPIECKKLTYHW